MKVSELSFARSTIEVRCSCGAVWHRTGLIKTTTRDDERTLKRFVKEHGEHEVAGLKCVSRLWRG
jgi:hypothetical protein